MTEARIRPFPARLEGRSCAGGADVSADRYRSLFENSPISLWEEDFSELKRYLDDLRESGVEDFREYFREHPDELHRCASMVLVVDVNEATLELLECDSKRRLVGRRLPVIFRKASYDVFLEELLALAEGLAVFEADVVNRTFSGRPIDVRVRLALAPGHEETWSKVFVSLTDISEWKQTQAQLELHRVAMQLAADAIFITGRDGAIEWVNQAFVRQSGYRVEEALGRPPSILGSDHHDEDHYRRMWRRLLEGRTYRGRTVNRRKDGSHYTVEQSVTPITDDAGEITHFVAVQQDISDRLESEERLVRMAQSDQLTGLPNRYTFNDRLEREAIRAERKGESVAVLLLDIDHFKDVNDVFGHAAGDALLLAVAERLKRSLRSLDTVARLGGDEFAVLQTDADRPESTATLAQRLISTLEPPFEIDGHTIIASVSVGIALGKAGEIDPKLMIRQADLALCRAKRVGRGTFRFHVEAMDDEVSERLTLSRDLRAAIHKEELFLVFQPQIDLTSGRVSAIEALLRWRHPEFGLVPPDRFIPLAESNGFIVPLGEWVLRTACEEVARLRHATGPDLMLAVNVSAVQMRSPAFCDSVLRILDETGVAPHHLEIELTESVLMQSTPQLQQSLQQLHAAGVRFAVDDFGTGYSSMGYLRQFAVDKLKVDRSFLEHVEASASDAAIVGAILALGNKLGIRVLAEGVERRSQLDFLLDNGCDEVQGYYFSRPLPGDGLAQLFEGGHHFLGHASIA